MVAGMSVPEAIVFPAVVAFHLDNFLDLATLVEAFVDKDFSSTLAKVGLTVVVHVLTNGQIWGIASFGGNGGIAQRTDWHLNVLFVRTGAIVVQIRYMVRAKNRLASIASQGQEVEAITAFFGAVFSEVRELHFQGRVVIWKKDKYFFR